MQYYWLKIVVWYHTNFCFSENEVQILSIHIIRKNTIDESKLNVVVDGKHWIVVIDE